jgi:hypothetical protein
MKNVKKFPVMTTWGSPNVLAVKFASLFPNILACRSSPIVCQDS